MINAADFPATAIETDPVRASYLLCLSLIVLAVLLVIRDLCRQNQPLRQRTEKTGIQETATGIAATAFYIVAMSYCGYLITTVFLIVYDVDGP